MTPTVKVYGSDRCQDTQAALYHLDSLGVQHEYINIDQDPDAMSWLLQHNAGPQLTPTLDIQGTVLSAPDEPRLEDVLRAKGLMG
jgi:glutaredoxin